MKRVILSRAKEVKSNKSVGQRIRRARKEAGLSQKQLSQTLQISDKAVSAYEVGRTPVSFAILKRISGITHKPIAYFAAEAKEKDLNLQEKLNVIEKELWEIKQLLKRKKHKTTAS